MLENAKAIVIGAGFGGLAAAMRLGAKGYAVTLIDRLDEPGGRGTAHRQGGFRFDLGPTIVTAPEVFRDLWTACGRRFEDDVDLKALDPFYRIVFDDGSSFSAHAEREKLLAEAGRLSPSDRRGARLLLEDAAKRYVVGFEGLGRRPMHRFSELVKVLPAFAWLRADRSIYRHAARRVRDPRLRMAFSFHPLFIGGDPLAVTSMYALVSHLEGEYGVHYAMGGAVAMAKAMARVIEEQGGALRLGEEVDEILAEGGRAVGVRLKSGETLRAGVVVSNADAGHTYDRLLRNTRKRRWTPSKLARQRWSMGLFVWYFGTHGTRNLWPEVGHHTILSGPRYTGLTRDIFRRGVLADDMSLYLHRPSVTDASVAPAGGDAFYALSPVPHLGHADPVDWAETGERYRQKVQERLEQYLLPGLSARLAESHVMTPVDFRDRYLSPFGAGFSIEPRILQSAWFRPHNRSEELEGLYLVGAGTHPGAGLPGVVCSAEVVDQLVPPAPGRGAPHRRGRAPSPSASSERPKERATADMQACRDAIRTGSYSFYAASKLLPARVRQPALALYAFCRLADDAVDLTDDKATAVARLRERLEQVYAGRPRDAAADRAFADVVAAFRLPRALPEALLEGFAWDAEHRRYETVSDVRAYGARVAGSVGAMMCLLMGATSRDALARACDLGLAMQLTNIARDVGEDARAGRLYLPLDVMRTAGLDPERFLRKPEASPALTQVVKDVLREAERLYRRAETGVAALPVDCRAAIFAARNIYGAIGDEIAAVGFDSVTRRARTTRLQKALLIGKAAMQTSVTFAMPRSALIHATPTRETEYLVEAAAEAPPAPIPWGDGRTGRVLEALAMLNARERGHSIRN